MNGELMPPTLIKLGETYYCVPYYQIGIRKLAALAGDLRAVKFSGEKKVATNAPTEGSKQQAYKQLSKSQRVGQVGTLQKMGPTIRQVAVKVR